MREKSDFRCITNSEFRGGRCFSHEMSSTPNNQILFKRVHEGQRFTRLCAEPLEAASVTPIRFVLPDGVA